MTSINNLSFSGLSRKLEELPNRIKADIVKRKSRKLLIKIFRIVNLTKNPIIPVSKKLFVTHKLGFRG